MVTKVFLTYNFFLNKCLLFLELMTAHLKSLLLFVCIHQKCSSKVSTESINFSSVFFFRDPIDFTSSLGLAIQGLPSGLMHSCLPGDPIHLSTVEYKPPDSYNQVGKDYVTAPTSSLPVNDSHFLASLVISWFYNLFLANEIVAG